jgi:hypothetical protein
MLSMIGRLWPSSRRIFAPGQDLDIGLIVRGQCAESGGDTIERLDDLARVAGKRFARGRGNDSGVLAYEQRDCQPVLEVGDAFAGRRSDHVLALCGAGDAAVIDRADEQLERGEVETHGGRVWHAPKSAASRCGAPRAPVIRWRA